MNGVGGLAARLGLYAQGGVHCLRTACVRADLNTMQVGRAADFGATMFDMPDLLVQARGQAAGIFVSTESPELQENLGW